MKNKKIITVLSVISLAAIASAGALIANTTNNNYKRQKPKTIERDSAIEQTPNQNVTHKNSEIMEDKAADDKLIALDVPKDASDNKPDSYAFFDIKSGQHALSSAVYEIKEGAGLFKYTISWDPMGNFIRVGLADESENNQFYDACISGSAEGVIDLSHIPAGNYHVMVHNETSNKLDLNGAITYSFTKN
ncbi:MAG: hypothetical protein HFH29_13725 [Eubacterium sp.]|nr:hypothetical protein [Eubacterium sp.]